jgi:biopolymer transport protein ExbD
MAMAVGGKEGEPMMEMNTTPLIDVMLVLLVMLIITIPVMTHATKLDMPQPTNSAVTEPPIVIRLTIDDAGMIYWNGEQVTMSVLESRFREEAVKDPQPELHIQPDRWAKYDFVAAVLAAAQRNRMEKIGFVGQEQYL